MPRPDEGLIHAWLDGELEAEEAARVERLVAEDAEWASAAAEARGLIAASSRILGALDVVAGDVIPKGASAAPALAASRAATSSVVPRRAMPTWLKLAASVVLVAGLSYVGLREEEVAMLATAPTAERMVPESAMRQRATVESLPAEQPAVAAPPAPAPSQRSATTAAAGAVANALIAKANETAPPAPSPVRSELSAGYARDAAAASTRGIAGGVASPMVRPAAPLVPSIAETAERESRLAAGGAAASSGLRVRSSAPAVAQSAALADEPAAKMAAEDFAQRMLAGCWLASTTVRVDSLQRDVPVVRAALDTLELALKPAGATATVVRVGSDEVRGRARDTGGRTAAFSARLVKCAP